MPRKGWRNKQRPGQREADWIALMQWFLPRLGYRWPGFRKVRNRVIKRLKRRMQRLQLETPDEYRHYLERHDDEWALLDAMCAITISRFWRDRAVFNNLCEHILPALSRTTALRTEPLIRAWSLGCSCGEEPYSLLLAWELGLSAQQRGPCQMQILATDSNPTVLHRAREGIYPQNNLRELPAAWRETAFEPIAEEYQLKARMRRQVRFQCQDLRQTMPTGPFDLILCRNLLYTYFQPAQQRLYQQQLIARLRQGGFLVVGCHEHPEPDDKVQWLEVCPSIYRSEAAPSSTN